MPFFGDPGGIGYSFLSLQLCLSFGIHIMSRLFIAFVFFPIIPIEKNIPEG
ncbi:MAG: hypothetical protein QME05_06410 [Candidatus Margulisbacteria bacterium]|nr:hypothetical protein [Candidatus Margulisiibacteriota bacterium]